MIQQFRNLNFFNLIILFVLLFVLRVGVFWHLPEVINSGFNSFFYRLLLPIEFDKLISPTLSVFLAALLVYAQALIFNKIINTYNILGKATFMPALFFIVCASVFTPFLILSPPLICNFFILWMLAKILGEYKSSNSTLAMLDLGLITALGTIVYFPFVAFFLILWLSLILFKPFNWREWTSAFLGYICIVFFLGVYYYWNNNLLNFYEIWKPLSSKIPFYVNIKVLDYIVLFPISLAALMAIFLLRNNFFRSYVLVRKTFQLLAIMFVISILSFYLNPDFRINHFLISIIPIALLLSYYFLNAQKKWIYESLFFIMMIFIVYFQFV